MVGLESTISKDLDKIYDFKRKLFIDKLISLKQVKLKFYNEFMSADNFLADLLINLGEDIKDKKKNSLLEYKPGQYKVYVPKEYREYTHRKHKYNVNEIVEPHINKDSDINNANSTNKQFSKTSCGNFSNINKQRSVYTSNSSSNNNMNIMQRNSSIKNVLDNNDNNSSHILKPEEIKKVEHVANFRKKYSANFIPNPEEIAFEKNSLFFNKSYSSIHLFKSKNIDLENKAANSNQETENYENISMAADGFNYYNKLDALAMDSYNRGYNTKNYFNIKEKSNKHILHPIEKAKKISMEIEFLDQLIKNNKEFNKNYNNFSNFNNNTGAGDKLRETRNGFTFNQNTNSPSKSLKSTNGFQNLAKIADSTLNTFRTNDFKNNANKTNGFGLKTFKSNGKSINSDNKFTKYITHTRSISTAANPNSDKAYNLSKMNVSSTQRFKLNHLKNKTVSKNVNEHISVFDINQNKKFILQT